VHGGGGIGLRPSQTAVAKCVLNALSPGRSRALVDAEGLPQVGGGLAGIAVLEVARPSPSRARASSKGTPMSRARVSAWVWRSRAWLLAEVQDDSLPRRLSASA
jgi:hypothetical protein